MTRQYKDTETRRQEVAASALRTITEVGVGGFTTKAVAARVGISDGTLFRHFGSKREIVLEAMGLLEVGLLKSLISTGNAKEDIKAFFFHRAIFVGEKDAVGALIFSNELVHLVGEEGENIIQNWRKKSLKHLTGLLRTLKKEDRTNPDLSVAEMRILIQGVLLTFVMERTRKTITEDKKAFDQRVKKAWKLLQVVLFK